MKHLLLLVILTFVVYANSLNGGFVFDDQQLIFQNPQLINIRSLGDVISLAGGWRQLLVFTYGLNYYLGQLDTFSYHLFNIFLHAVNCILVYFIVLAAVPRMPNRDFIALAGASIFSVHTLLTGAVSYIAGRSSVLCGTFYFAAILLFFKAVDSERPGKRALFLSLTAVAGFLAWQAKQEAIALPVFLASAVFLRTEKINWRWILPLFAAPVLLLVVIREEIAALYAGVMQNQTLVAAGFEQVLEPAAYFRTYITAVVGYYLPRMVMPTGLSVDPQVAEVQHWYSPELLFSLLVLGGLAWFALRYRKQEPLAALGVAALLASPLLAYAAIPLADVVQEHRAYIPGLGAALLAAAAFRWILRRHADLKWVALIAILLGFSMMTVARNRVWANNITLWTDAEQKGPGKPRAHFNLGQAFQDAKRMPDAIREYEHALALKPDIHAAYSNMAAIYIDTGQLEKGEETLLKITNLAPDFTEGFVNLAVLYLRRQDFEKALGAVDRAIEINSESFPAHYNRGEILLAKGEVDEAVKSYSRAAYLRPDVPSVRLSLGVAYQRAGQSAAAEKEFVALTTGPLAAEAYRNLGVLYNERNEVDRAIELLQQAVRLRPGYLDGSHDLGILYLRKSDPTNAIQYLRSVVQQKPDFGPGVLNLALAYEMKGDRSQARQVLSAFLQVYGRSNSPFVAQVQQRLSALN